MISIRVDSMEYYDDESGMFFLTEERDFSFEHSLRSISAWESVYRIPLLHHTNMTGEQFLYYIECMALDDDFDISYATTDLQLKLVEYMKEKPTATTITKRTTKKKGDNARQGPRILTSEVIYAYMANGQIPFECDQWNIHRLLTLLDVIGELNSPPEKMSQEEVYQQYADINKKRRAMLNNSG